VRVRGIKAMLRVGPVRQPALGDAREDFVELLLAHEKRVVLDDEIAVRTDEVERDAVVELHAMERPEPDRLEAPEHLGQKGRGRSWIAGMNDRVIQVDGHGGAPGLRPKRTPQRLLLARDDNAAMSEESQIVVPPSFIALFIEPGRSRPSASHAQIAARHEICEDVAAMLTEHARTILWQLGIAEEDVLERVHAGLLSADSGVSGVEAEWVTCRLAEMLEWECRLFGRA
jgi:hypothetical protein